MTEELSVGEATAELLKELTDEIRRLNSRIESLEQREAVLVKAMDDPATLMQKAGWLRATTPLADETFDPLQRDSSDGPAFTSAFNSGDGALISKSHDERLREWQEAEAAMPAKISPSSRNYR